MKLKVYIPFFMFFFFTFSANAQIDTALIGKSFIAKIGSVCQETATYDRCAGYQIFLELHFKKDTVEILQKEISSCNKIRYENKYFTEWTFEKPDKINLNKLPKNLEDIYTFSLSKSLIYHDRNLTGKSNRTKEEFIFEPIVANPPAIPQNIKTNFEGTWVFEQKNYSNTVIIKFEKGKDYATFTDIGTGEAPTRVFEAIVKGNLLIVTAQQEKNDYVEMEVIKGKLHLRSRPTVWDEDGNAVNNNESAFLKTVFKRKKRKILRL